MSIDLRSNLEQVEPMLLEIKVKNKTTSNDLNKIEEMMSLFKNAQETFAFLYLEYENLKNEQSSFVDQELQGLFKEEERLITQLSNLKPDESSVSPSSALAISSEVSCLWAKTMNLKKKVDYRNQKASEIRQRFFVLESTIKNFSFSEVGSRNVSPFLSVPLFYPEAKEVSEISIPATYEEIVSQLFTPEQIESFEVAVYNSEVDILLKDAYQHASLENFSQKDYLNKDLKPMANFHGSVASSNRKISAFRGPKRGKKHIALCKGHMCWVPKKTAEGKIFLQQDSERANQKGVFKPGEIFFHAWKMGNEGFQEWPIGTTLREVVTEEVVTENDFHFTSLAIRDDDLPTSGHYCMIGRMFIAPLKPGVEVRRYRLADNKAVFFGERIELTIEVKQ